MSGNVAKLEHADAPIAFRPVGDDATVMRMIEALIQRPDVPIEKLQQIVALHERIKADQARREYLDAFSRLQAEMPPAVRRGTGHNNKRYARFEDVIEAARGPLCRYGFSLSFRVHHEGAVVRVTGVLGHAGGHQETTEMPLPADATGNKNNVQAWGSSISYGKRYVALTLLGIATDDDDDGQKASGVITGEQAKVLAKLITETGTDIAKFLELGGVESLSDIPAAQFEAAKGKLMAKKVHMQKGAKP